MWRTIVLMRSIIGTACQVARFKHFDTMIAGCGAGVGEDILPARSFGTAGYQRQGPHQDEQSAAGRQNVVGVFQGQQRRHQGLQRQQPRSAEPLAGTQCHFNQLSSITLHLFDVQMHSLADIVLQQTETRN